MLSINCDDKFIMPQWPICRSADKRVSAVAISHNGQYVAFADKFGVVWLTGLDEDDAKQPKVDVKAVPILGHYCSIITRLVCVSSVPFSRYPWWGQHSCTLLAIFSLLYIILAKFSSFCHNPLYFGIW